MTLCGKQMLVQQYDRCVVWLAKQTIDIISPLDITDINIEVDLSLGNWFISVALLLVLS